MRILIDADACPVKREAIALARQHNIPVILIANFHHSMQEEPGVQVIVSGDAPDEVDLRIANAAEKGDIVVTQDYPLAALALGKGAKALSPRGLVYTEDNIYPLLEERHRTLAKIRNGKFPKGPKPFSPADRAKFVREFGEMLSAEPQHH